MHSTYAGRLADTCAAALFRLLLVAYPRAFRRRWGQEMRATFLTQLRAGPRPSRARYASVLLRELAGLAVAGVRARFPSSPPTPPRRRENIMDTSIRDLRVAARSFLRNPLLSASVVAVAGIGIGAVTAIFSAVDAALLRPLPMRDPARLVMVWEENPERGWYQQTAAPANFLDWREQVDGFADAAAYADFLTSATITGTGEAERIRTRAVTGNFFDVLGVRPAIGRAFEDRETWSDAQPVVLLTDGFWERRFGRDPRVVGTHLTLDGVAYEVVGVMPPRFQFPGTELDAWVPMRWAPADVSQAFFRRAHFLRVIARLDDGVTLTTAEAQLRVVAGRLEEQYPELNRLMGAGITPLQPFLVGDSRTPLLVLFGATGLLLLLTCANIANLLLVRAAGRRRDVAVRSALGAGPGRLARQLLTESTLLAAVGGVLGVVIGTAAFRALAAIAPADLAGFQEAALDARVLVFAFATTLLTGLAFGLLPAFRSARVHPGDAMRESARTGGVGPRGRRVGSALVVSEIALALLIVTAAGLLVRSFLALRSVDAGFAYENRLSARVSLPASKYETAERILAFADDLQRRLEALPGVDQVTFASRLPLTGQSYTSDFRIRGEARYGTEVVHRTVSENYFSVMGVPLLAGRFFTPADALGGERVAIINDAFRRDHFGTDDPLGKLIAFEREPGEQAHWYRIVGVAGSERQNGLAQPARMEIFETIRQDVRRDFSLVLHTSVPPAGVTPAARRVLAGLDADLPLFGVRTLDEVYAEALARDRFLLLLVSGFAAVALILAVLGVYGVAAEAARHRTQEIGIRVALGATRADVLWLILRQAATLVTLGLAVGLASGLLSARFLSGILYGVPPRDAVTFAIVPMVVAAAALLASWLPARRAARLDAARALRTD